MLKKKGYWLIEWANGREKYILEEDKWHLECHFGCAQQRDDFSMLKRIFTWLYQNSDDHMKWIMMYMF